MHSSSACERRDWLLVRGCTDPAAVDDAVLAARGPRPLEVPPRDELPLAFLLL